MGIELFFAALALILVPLSNGSLKKLIKTNFKSKWTLVLVAAGLLIIAFAPIPENRYDDLGFGILLASYVLLIGFVIANISIKGIWLALIGLCSNAIVIALNLGMPVKTSADYVPVETIKHQASTSNDLLTPLSDIIVFDRLKVSISVGDIIFGCGLVLTCILLSRKDKKDTPIVEDFEIEEIIDENFAEREELTVGDEEEYDVVEAPAQSTLFRIESELMPLTSMENDLEFIEQVQVLESQNVIEEEIEYIVVDAPEPILQEVEVVTIDLAKEVKAESRKYKGSTHKKSRKRVGINSLPSKEELGFTQDSMEIVEAAN